MPDFYLPLSVSLIASNVFTKNGVVRQRFDEHEKHPAYNKVIRPLLDNSREAFVYGLTEQSELLSLNKTILIKDKGKYKFDKGKECIKGHEFLWNANAWKRGSIVMIMNKDFDFEGIFKHCARPGLLETPNSGNSPSAIKKCKEEANKGNIGICFTASNGIELIAIYTDISHRDKLYQLAYEHCKERDWT